MTGIAILAAALAVQLLLRRAARLLSIALAKRRPPDPKNPAAALLAWRERLWLASIPLSIALWSAALIIASAYDDTLMRVRELASSSLRMAVSAPLFRLGDMPYTAVDLVLLPLLLAALWIGIGALTNLANARLARLLGGLGGASLTAALLARYAFTLLGAIVLFQAWGIDLSSLAIFASVLGVAIGFGLQNIASNFISGILIGIERPIQPGDFVDVGEHRGTVQKIGARSTSILTLDRVTILVPNSRFLEREVVNWSHGDPVSRLHVPVSVGYESNIGTVRAALLESAHSHPEVLGDPRARVELRSFGESSLEFDLLVWTAEPRNQSRVKSDLYFRIEENLRAHGIGIPFPQRDVNLPPELLRLATAFTRRHFSVDEIAAAEPTHDAGVVHDAGHSPGARWAAFDAALGPREWDDEALALLVERMRGEGGVAISDRRHLLTTYPRCFVGREAVDWIARNEGLSRADAIEAGRKLVMCGLVRHVLDEHGFEDALLFYRFAADVAP